MTNKYLRTIYGVDTEGNAGSLQVDVYDILDAYPTRNPALDHLVKKALCPGQRGHKDLLTDLDDIIASAQRAKQMTINKMSCMTEVVLEDVPVLTPEREKALKEGGAKVRFEPGAPAPQADLQLQGNLDQERIAEYPVLATPFTSAAATRPTCFDGKVLCYYPDKLQAEGILKTFQELAQKAGIVTKAVQRAGDVGADCILIDSRNPRENVIRRFIDQGVFLYGVREANVILRGHLARDKEKDVPAPSKPTEDYDYSFSDRPETFDNAIIYLVDGQDPGAVERLEIEAKCLNTEIEYVRSHTDCPDGAVVVHDNGRKLPRGDGRWHFTVDSAIHVLIKDKKGGDIDA